MSIFKWGTTEEKPIPSSEGTSVLNTTKIPFKSAVESIKTPSLLERLSTKLGTSSVKIPSLQPKKETAKSMVFPLITGPKPEELETRATDLVTRQSKINPTKRDEIDQYNNDVSLFNKDLERSRMSQNARQAVTTPSLTRTPLQNLSHDLSQILNEPIKIAGNYLGNTKVFEDLARKSDENRVLPSFIEELSRRLQYAQSALSGVSGGIIQPEYTEEPTDASGKLVRILSEGVGMATSIGAIESGLFSKVSAPTALVSNFKNYPKVGQFFNSLAKTIPAFATYGQLNPELATAKDRIKTLGRDILTAVPFTALGLFDSKAIQVPVSAALGFGLAKLSGASNTDAAISGTALGLLSLMGGAKKTSKELITREQAKGILYDEAINVVNKYSNIKITKNSSTEEIKKAYRNAALATHPDRGGDSQAFRNVTYARDVLLGEGRSTEGKFSGAKTAEEMKQDIQNVANDIKTKPTTESNPEIKKQVDDIGAKFNKKPIETKEVSRVDLKEVPVSTERAQKIIDRLKLRGADPVLVDAIITPSGERAYGVATGGTVAFEKVVEQYTEDHEVGHIIFENMDKMALFKDFDKKALLDEARTLYGDKKDVELEEDIMKDFQQYVNERESNKQTTFFGKVREFFERLYASFKRLFKSENDIKEFYRVAFEGKAKEDTVIDKNLPDSFNQKVREGVLDFRTQSSVQNFLKEVPVADAFNDSGDLTLKTIQKLEGRTTVSKQFIEDLTNSGDIKQVERDLIRDVLETQGDRIDVKEFVEKVKAELLPLTVVSSEEGESLYEYVSLPEEIRGNVANYVEHVYESPVRTSAGKIHFGEDAENYFGHVRLEDMQDIYTEERGGLAEKQDTRRILEVQSDLYQKGRLEEDANKLVNRMTDSEAIEYKRLENIQQNGETFNERESAWSEMEKLRNNASNRPSNINKKLAQYTNPTAHFRMVREEIKLAAKDGKTKLQFPSGETAMKIEGLGSINNFRLSRGLGRLTPDRLKVGEEITQGGNDKWIITDVLEDGKFKAVQKDSQGLAVKLSEIASKDKNFLSKYFEKGRIIEGYNGQEDKVISFNPQEREGWSVTVREIGDYQNRNHATYPNAKNIADYYFEKNDTQSITEAAKKVEAHTKEQFDISGKVDTNNPIYRFYEKDLARYLKSNYDATPIMDENGVTWNEVKVDPAYADIPTLAFNVKPDIEVLRRQLERTKHNLEIAISNPEAHIKAYGPDRVQEYRDKILDLEARIRESKNPNFDSGDKLSDLRQALAFVERRMGVKPAVKTISVSGKDIELPEELQLGQVELEVRQEEINNNPLEALTEYVAKSGEFEGQLPEVLGKTPEELKNSKAYKNIKSKKTLQFIQEGDKIIKEIVGSGATYGKDPDVEQVRADMVLHLKGKEDLKNARKILKAEIKRFKDMKKDEIALAKMAQQDGKEAFVTVEDLEPPKARGGIAAPKLDLKKWKDRNVARLNRETFERNIYDVMPKEDADKVKAFIVDPVKKAETNRIEYVNDIREEIREKMKSLGIKKGSKQDEYIQRYGEGNEAEGGVSLDTLKADLPKDWENVVQGSEYFRKKYDELIDKVNTVRTKFDYKLIPKRKDYFRHFEEINNAITQFGVMFRDENLPTAIAGITETFNPGKPFSTVEMRRLGRKTSFSAIKGMDNYIDAISKQIFHTESIQRYRALEKYIRKAASVPSIPEEQLRLSNFVTNLNDTANFMAGKKGRLDRAVESAIGRGFFSGMQKVSRRVASNLIALNVSSALTNLIAIATQVPATTQKLPYIKGLYSALVMPFKGNFAEIDKGITSDFITRRFPEEKISSTSFEKVEDISRLMFTAVDKFVSYATVSAKYWENISKGMSKEDAIKDADEYAGKVITDRSFGQIPTFFQNKSLTLFTQFQLEVNNIYSFLKKDIPKQYQGNIPRIMWSIIQFFIFSYLFNEAYEKIIGRRPTIDPINAALTLAGINDEGRGLPIEKRALKAGEDLGGNLPYIGFIFQGGRIPISAGFPRFRKLARGETTLKEEIKRPLFNLLPPFAGSQIKKTIEGVKAFKEGEVTNSRGNKNFDVPQTVGNAIRMTLFGKYGSPEAREFFNEQDRLYSILDEQKKDSANLESKAEKTWIRLQTMTKEDAKNSLKEIAKEDPKLAEKVLEVIDDEGKGLDANDRIIKQFKVENGEKARYIYGKISNMKTNDEKKAYLKELAKKGVMSEKVLDQVLDMQIAGKPIYPEGEEISKTGFLNSVALWAKATGKDPELAFRALFSKEQIESVEGNRVMLKRISFKGEDGSESIAQSRSKEQGVDRKTMRLDHKIPLEIGGDNSEGNLELITVEEWKRNTPVENYIGKLLKDKKIKRKEAQKAIIDFKAGLITFEEIKEKYPQ